MNDIKQCIHVMGEGQTLQIDFSGEAQVEKEIEPARLKEELQKMQPGETLIVRFDYEES